MNGRDQIKGHRYHGGTGGIRPPGGSDENHHEDSHADRAHHCFLCQVRRRHPVGPHIAHRRSKFQAMAGIRTISAGWHPSGGRGRKRCKPFRHRSGPAMARKSAAVRGVRFQAAFAFLQMVIGEQVG